MITLLHVRRRCQQVACSVQQEREMKAAALFDTAAGCDVRDQAGIAHAANRERGRELQARELSTCPAGSLERDQLSPFSPGRGFAVDVWSLSGMACDSSNPTPSAKCKAISLPSHYFKIPTIFAAWASHSATHNCVRFHEWENAATRSFMVAAPPLSRNCLKNITCDSPHRHGADSMHALTSELQYPARTRCIILKHAA